MNAHTTLMAAHLAHSESKQLNDIAQWMFEMWTQNGFPPDMFLDELDKRFKLPKSAKIYVVSEYQTKFMEHKRLAGATEKNLEKQRRKNKEDIERLINSGETGIY